VTKVINIIALKIINIKNATWGCKVEGLSHRVVNVSLLFKYFM